MERSVISALGYPPFFLEVFGASALSANDDSGLERMNDNGDRVHRSLDLHPRNTGVFQGLLHEFSDPRIDFERSRKELPWSIPF